MSDRASSGVFPLVLFALILVISAVAVVLGADDANSAGTTAVGASSEAAASAGAAAGAAAGRVDSR